MAFHIDYETYSTADLPSVGSWRYAFDPSTEILCMAIAHGDDEPALWLPAPYRPTDYDPAPADSLLNRLVNSDEPVYAHNVGFEFPITEALWEKTTGLSPIAVHRWRCTAAMARKAALPHSLAKCAAKLGLAQQKDSKGSALIRKFSMPQKDGRRIKPKDDPEAFKVFCEYCVQDVRVEQEIHQKLKAFELTGFQLEVFQADLLMNQRGIPINLDAVRNAKKIVDEASTEAVTEFKALTGLDPTQVIAFREWLAQRGVDVPDLRAETIDELLDSDELEADGDAGRALELRRRVSFAATKKLDAFEAYAGPHDNKVRGILMFYGAIRTGRWSSSGPQVQNAKKPKKALKKFTDAIYSDIKRGATAGELQLVYGNPIECVASCIRNFVDDGKPMLNADYSAIEARVLAWLAGEQWRIEVFKTHGMIYEASIAQMLGIAIDKVDEDLRQKGKLVELSCGFGGSIGALMKMGADKLGLPKEAMQDLIDKWRAANPSIKSFWSKCEFAARSAIANPGQKYGVNGKAQFFCARTAGLNYLFVRLPSGRCLAYPEPKVESVMASWGEPTEAITFFGQFRGKQAWGRVHTYGADIAQSITQGSSVDIMASGLVQCQRARYEINALVHDEALAYLKDGQDIETFCNLLTALPEWAEGLPLEAKGCVIPYYRK
jgi:DNA polymerase